MSNKLLILKGVPASGKTTRAEEIINGGGNFKRVNRDLLRKMLHFDKWTSKNEALTIQAEKTLAKMLLTDHNVVVDDTNLTQKHEDMWREVAKQAGATFEIEEMPHLSLRELFLRDANRGNSVGQQTILKAYMKIGYWRDKVVLCDIDGTIADCTHRLEYVEKEPKDWKGFFSRMSDDTFRSDVWESVRMDAIAADAKIIMVTARPAQYRWTTQFWLEENGVEFDHMIMRENGDKRPDVDVKQDMLNLIGKENIVRVYDDRMQVIKMWEENGLEVVNCGTGVDF